jgi:hypothetical protein
MKKIDETGTDEIRVRAQNFSMLCTNIYAMDFFRKQHAHMIMKTGKIHGVEFAILNMWGDIVIVIQGTNDLKTALHDGMIWKTSEGLEPFKFHAGFNRIADHLSNVFDMSPTVKNSKRLYITGHSAGGAIAQILAYHLEIRHEIEVEKVYAFGAPMITTHSHACRLQAGHISKKIYNFMLEKDEVTDVPVGLPFFYDYQRIGRLFWLNVGDNPKKIYTTDKYRRITRNPLKNFWFETVDDHAPLHYFRCLSKAKVIV